MSKAKGSLPISWECHEWAQFWEALYQILYGEFGEPAYDPLECKGNHDHSRRILQEMGGFDVDATIKLFKERGGYCDCRVVWDVPEMP